jgi:hypothetical protein
VEEERATTTTTTTFHSDKLVLLHYIHNILNRDFVLCPSTKV